VRWRLTVTLLPLAWSQTGIAQRAPRTRSPIQGTATPRELRGAAMALYANRVPGLDTVTSFDPVVLQEVAVSLRAIRSTLPELGPIIDYQPPNPALSLILTSVAGRRALSVGQRYLNRYIGEHWRFPRRRGVPTIGSRGLDSLSRTFGATSLTMTVTDPKSADPGALAIVEFPATVNLPRILAAYEQSPDVLAAVEGSSIIESPDRPIRISADSSNRVWTFVFNEGRGDCMSGCREYLRTVLLYDRDVRRVTLVRRDTASSPRP
jgi:hypothetical protein